MAAAGDARGARDGAGAGDGAPQPKQGIDDAVRELGAAGRATLEAGRDAGKAFRILLAADISLARSAFGRTLALTGVAIAFGASAWLLLMAALIVGLSRGLGMPWALALLLTALLSVAVTAGAAWMATRYFEHTRLKATRRQLARLGIGELADFMPDPGSGEAASVAAAKTAAATGEGEPVKKGLGIDVTPP
jgi:hypothetical protein